MLHVTLNLTSPSHRPRLITSAGQSLLQAIIVKPKMQCLFGFDTWEFVNKTDFFANVNANTRLEHHKQRCQR